MKTLIGAQAGFVGLLGAAAIIALAGCGSSAATAPPSTPKPPTTPTTCPTHYDGQTVYLNGIPSYTESAGLLSWVTTVTDVNGKGCQVMTDYDPRDSNGNEYATISVGGIASGSPPSKFQAYVALTYKSNGVTWLQVVPADDVSGLTTTLPKPGKAFASMFPVTTPTP